MNQFNKRNGAFIVLSGIAFLMAFRPLWALLQSTTYRHYYSYIVLIPVVSLFLLYSMRKRLFSSAEYSYGPGIILLTLGIGLYFVGESYQTDLDQIDLTALMVLSTLIFWIGGIVFFYGVKTFRSVTFPVLFLAFMMPIPNLLMEGIISILQIGSGEAVNILFKTIGIPYSREGVLFHLPGLSIEIARQCTGIRSSLALFIIGILVAQLFLRTGWRKLILISTILPITILKNGIRIVSLSVLGVYVNEKLITKSFLHHSGGFLFFIISLLLLGLGLWWLRRSEKGLSKNKKSEVGV